LPTLHVHDSNKTSMSLSLLTMFLPTTQIPTLPPFLEGETNVPAFYWLPTLFHVWTMTLHLGPLDLIYMEFLDRLAEDQLGHPEYVLWTEDQLAHIFSVGLHLMNLPVGSKKPSKPMGGNASSAAVSGLMDSQKKGKMEVFASLIVNLIFPSTLQIPSAFPHLKKLIHILENFLHPSNHGQWTTTLTRFVAGLSSSFLSRLRRGEFRLFRLIM
jgi:proteasome activator subunit 4